MPVIRTTGNPRHNSSTHPGVLVLAKAIAAPTAPWAGQALCAQTDPDLFFSDSVTQTEQAKETCRRCPVRAECLSHALEARGLRCLGRPGPRRTAATATSHLSATQRAD